MKFIKKNQVAVFSLLAVVVMAAYVNYRYNPERENKLGETVFVNSKEGYVYDSTQNNIENQTQVQDENKTQVQKEPEKEDVLAEIKMQRDNMNSELIESYNKIINNESTSSEKVSQYQEKLNDLISTKHLVTMVENIIKTNGIENIVIVPTNGNINAIIASEDDLPKSKIAIVESAIKNEFNVDSSKISISVKKSINEENIK